MEEINIRSVFLLSRRFTGNSVNQCFSTVGPRLCTGPWRHSNWPVSRPFFHFYPFIFFPVIRSMAGPSNHQKKKKINRAAFLQRLRTTANENCFLSLSLCFQQYIFLSSLSLRFDDQKKFWVFWLTLVNRRCKRTCVNTIYTSLVEFSH